MPPPIRLRPLLATVLLASCGGGSGGGGGSTSAALVIDTLSTTGLLNPGCGTAVAGSADAYTPGSAVQPQLAASAGTRLATVWEQDRWNAIGARAIALSTSADGGASWSSPSVLPFSICGGGTGPGMGYDRASDPSVAAGQDASGAPVLVASALAFSAANYLAPGGLSAVLVSRSLDGGQTWQAVQAPIQDVGASGVADHFNDRDAIAADPAGPDAYPCGTG